MFQCWFLNKSVSMLVSKEISVSNLVPKCQQGNKCFNVGS